MPAACTCYLKVVSITGVELQQLDCRLSQNILCQYMSGFMKTVLTSAQPPWQFSKKLPGIFQSINHRQPDNTQCTHPACLWLAGWLPATKPTGHDWQRLSYKQKISSFAKQNASLCDPPHPPGDNCWAFPLVPAGSQATKLSTTTLHDGAPPAFWSTARASLPAIAGRQAKKFWPKVDTVLKNPDIYWPGMPGTCLQLAPATSKWSPSPVWSYSS